MESPLFCLLSPCFTPFCKSQAPHPVLTSPRAHQGTRCHAPPPPQPPRSARPPRCAPSAAAPLPLPPPSAALRWVGCSAGAALQGRSAQARHARSPARGGWGQRCAAMAALLAYLAADCGQGWRQARLSPCPRGADGAPYSLRWRSARAAATPGRIKGLRPGVLEYWSPGVLESLGIFFSDKICNTESSQRTS